MSETRGNRKVLLIFGISGFVGPYLAREFHANGYEVVGIDVTNNRNVPDFVTFKTCDILDEALVRDLIQEVDPTHIVNLAALSNVGLSWKFPQKTVSINVIGSLNIIEAMRECENPSRLLLVGSSEEYMACSEPISEKYGIRANSPYGLSKEMLDKFSNIYRGKYGWMIFYVRSFNHTGVGQTDAFVIPSWCKQVAEIAKSGKSGTLHVGNIDLKRDFSDVRDVVRAYRLVIESDEADEIYNIGSGRAYSLREILEYIISLSGQEITIDVDAERIRSVENAIIWCDNSKISRKFNWEPQYKIQDTIKEIYEYFLNADSGKE